MGTPPAALEGVIERGRETFVEVGQALLEIRDLRLYRESYDSFEDYCRERWQLSQAAAYRAIDAARVVSVDPMKGEYGVRTAVLRRKGRECNVL